MTALFNYPERQNVVKNACDLIIENEIIREEELRFYNIIIALFLFVFFSLVMIIMIIIIIYIGKGGVPFPRADYLNYQVATQF